jgi:UMF1 family MFS transporter
MFQGGIQSLSRSYFARIIPKEHSNEYFGLFNIFCQGAVFVGPVVLCGTMLFTRQAKLGVLPLLVLFAIGFVFMRLLPKEEQVSRPIA